MASACGQHGTKERRLVLPLKSCGLVSSTLQAQTELFCATFDIPEYRGELRARN